MTQRLGHALLAIAVAASASAILTTVAALGSRLDQDQNATTLAKATAEAKLAASLS
jgi:hypothetical protein